MQRFQSSCRLAFLIGVLAAGLLGVVFFLKAWKGLPTELLTRDPNAMFDAPLYIGFLSQVGIFFWAAAVAVCLQTLLVLPSDSGHAESRRFLLSAALLTLMLALDDAFLLHEQFFPFIGIPEKVVYIAYGVFTLFVLIRFRDLICQTEYPLLVAALLLFAASVSLDWLQPEEIDIFLIEDGAKLIGILCWLAYFSHAAYSMAARLVKQTAKGIANLGFPEDRSQVALDPVPLTAEAWSPN